MKGSKFTHEVMQPLRVESGLSQLDLEIYLLKAEVDRLTSGPGGIMEMKQTIANKEDEIKRLRFLLWEADCMISEGDADHAQSLIREELMEKE